MAKAMGLNAIATYVMWNFHQPSEDTFDFTSPSHDLGRFLQLAHEEGLYVLLRPGPYVCAEWDFGGLPYWFLNYDDIKVRTFDKRYLSFVERYYRKLAEVVIPFQITNGGPIVMFQIENEYGYYGNDQNYLGYLQKLWGELGVSVPFYTADGASAQYVSNGHVFGAAIGLDSGITKENYDMADKIDSRVVSFSSETYPGWLTHWGEKWAGKTTSDFLKEIDFILGYGKSFSMYMIHGGTNWGFWAGANDGDKGYQAHITSYDYDAPVTENGNATEKYFALRDLISKYVNETLPPVPEPIKTIRIPKVDLDYFSNIWQDGQRSHYSAYPKHFEYFNQFSGVIIYRTNLTGKTSGNLTVDGLGDYALVFADEQFIGTLDRSQAVFSIALPNNGKNFSRIELVVEGMGRINFGSQMTDRKGIKGNVSLDGEVLSGWSMTNLPFDDEFVGNLRRRTPFYNLRSVKQGVIYRGKFQVQDLGDTFIDVSQWQKGIVFVNGKNLGRYWNIGPQFRLYCPASFLVHGENEILILDFHQMVPSYITGEFTLKN